MAAEAEKMAGDLDFEGITQGLMDYKSVGSAKASNTKKAKKAKKAKKGGSVAAAAVKDKKESLQLGEVDTSMVEGGANKGKKSKGKKATTSKVDDDSELFENEKNLEDLEILKDLNE